MGDESEEDWLAWVRRGLVGLMVLQALLLNPFFFVYGWSCLALGKPERGNWRAAIFLLGVTALLCLVLAIRGLGVEGESVGIWPKQVFVFGELVAVGLCVAGIAGLWAPGTLRRVEFGERGLKCPGCGYDLKSSPVKCPECGWVVDGEMRAKLEREYPALRPRTSVEDWRSPVDLARPVGAKVEERQVVSSEPVRPELPSGGRERWLNP